MTKNKKKHKRINKNQILELLRSFFTAHSGEIFSLKQIFRILKFTTHPAKMLAIQVMDELAWDDFLSKISENSYTLSTKGQVQDGVFIRKSDGKNSFLPDDGTPIFISERNSMAALNGDRVRVQLLARRRHHVKEGMVIEILKRKHETFVGRLQVDNDIAFLITQENLYIHDILIPKKALNGGTTDDRAVVRITKWPDSQNKNLIGEVIDVLGKAGNNDVEMNTILAQYGLPYRYPKAVEDAAAKISSDITENDFAEREDFRNVWTCTIDPHDAKDFDDALSIRSLDNGNYEVGVHIADVSHYVKSGDVIDKEAQRRATSIYLVDRTIPMLPERLCNFICSLRPNEEKLAYSVIFELDDRANVVDYRIVHTVIKSNHRYTYEDVQTILEENGVIDSTNMPAPRLKFGENYKGEHADKLVTLDRLAKLLRSERMKNGSINFESEELHFDIDEEGRPIRCYFKVSKDANKLIEEFMLIANKYVAQSVGKTAKGVKSKIFVYRVHDNPDPQKFESLRQFTSKLGYKLKSSSTKGATARALNILLKDIEGKPESKVIRTIALRSMMKAKYTTHNIGHFGLAFDYYTHFTSPIRRYPDTLVHRLLTRYSTGGHSVNQEKLEELCEHCSDMEQIAQNAERDSIKYKMVEFMSTHLGETFDAHISGIKNYGLYAEIDENHCEGLIPMRDLDDDYYDFDEDNYRLVGRHHHKIYQLGDVIRIKVASADCERRLLDFLLVK